ncbi:hypothetical protein TNCV_4100141 [Trichonephila clavipes]|nr:hypothetical protein TNCV_4100141 [Trichonephila clavipes]
MMRLASEHCFYSTQKEEVTDKGEGNGLPKFNAPTHIIILIPAKMNSPDIDDFIDMFSVPTPVSPLPPTPMASPSHVPSQDAIYDSLQPM